MVTQTQQAGTEDLDRFLRDLTRLMLRFSGEGAEGIDRVVRAPGRPPRLVLFLGGFFTLTVGSMGLRALTSLAGGHVLHGFRDLMDFVAVVTTIAVGLLIGAALLPDRTSAQRAATAAAATSRRAE